MPLFHFYLVLDDERELIGSMDLPQRGDAIPAGLRLTTKILTAIVRRNVEDSELQVQAVNDAGAIIYTFDVTRCTKDRNWPNGFMH